MQITASFLLALANAVTGAILVYFFNVLSGKADRSYVDLYTQEHKKYHEMFEATFKSELSSLDMKLSNINNNIMDIKECLGELRGMK